jgi:hypothetical protein
MGDMQTVRERMLDVATATFGELCDVERLDDGLTENSADSALAALVGSRIVSSMIEQGHFSLETLPVPSISRQHEMQLEVLWRRYQEPDADRDALVGALDRIVAELYQLTSNDLMTLELASAQPPRPSS